MHSRITNLRLIKAVSFCLILFFLLELISYVFRPLDNREADGMIGEGARGFYSEDADAYDTYFIGNSNGFSGLSPMVLWHEFGYTSYNTSESGQNIAQAVFMLNEITEKHHSKLIILEVDELYSGGFQVVLDSTINRLVPLFYNHSRWKTFKIKDLFRKTEYTRHRKNQGFWPSDEAQPYTGQEYMVETQEVEKIPKSARPFLDILVKTCKDKNIELMLTHLPSAVNWNYKRHNAVTQYAKEKGIKFLDLDCEREKIGFDCKTDFRDAGNHLNSSGALKATKRIGEFIKENYNLADHRGDSKYAHWDSDYIGYPHNAGGRE